MSHIYNDTGDASQILSGLTLMPLAPDKGTFTWADVDVSWHERPPGAFRTARRHRYRVANQAPVGPSRGTTRKASSIV
jgi:hypothetical protein